MTELNTVTSINTLQPANFTMLFDKIPNTEFHVRQVPLPTITLGVESLGYPDVPLHVPSDIVSFEPFSILFVVDETLTNWLEILNWMLEFRYKNLDWDDMTSDATLLLKDGDLKVVREFTYENCFPITLSEVTLSYTDETPEYLCSAVFQYDKFTEVK